MTKLTYWTIDRHDTDFIEQKIKEYEEQNPDIDIEMKVMADNYVQSGESLLPATRRRTFCGWTRGMCRLG